MGGEGSKGSLVSLLSIFSGSLFLQVLYMYVHKVKSYNLSKVKRYQKQSFNLLLYIHTFPNHKNSTSHPCLFEWTFPCLSCLEY